MHNARDRIGDLPLRVVAEVGFTLFVIYLLSGGPHGWIGGTTDDSGPEYEGNPRFQALLAMLYLVSLALTLKRPRAWFRATTSDLGLLALLGLVAASVLWSEAPEVSAVRAAALLGTSCFAVYFAVRYPLETQLRLLGLGLGVVVLYNAILAVTQFGSLGGGSFRGGFDHKNSLAKMMTMATAVFMCLAGQSRRRVAAIVTGVVAFGLIILSGSATGLVVALTLVAAFPLLRLLTGDVRLVVVLGIAGLLVLGIGALVVPQVVAVLAPALGRDVTLTGRTELWPVLIDMIRGRPWLGYGYSAFWSGDDGGLDISWQPTQAHNGFLEVTLALGAVGLVLFTIVCIRGVTRALVFLREDRTSARFWPLMYFGFVLLYNITEATTLGRNNILWVLFVSALITVSPAWRGEDGTPRHLSKWARIRRQRASVPTRAFTPSVRPRSIP
jgi:O-antigen ligase